jgi:hypothetical protein
MDKFVLFSTWLKAPPPPPTNLILSNSKKVVLYRRETLSLTLRAKPRSADISKRSANGETWNFLITYSYFASISLHNLQLTLHSTPIIMNDDSVRMYEDISRNSRTEAITKYTTTYKRVLKLPTSTQLCATWHIDSLDMVVLLYRWRHQSGIFWINLRIRKMVWNILRFQAHSFDEVLVVIVDPWVGVQTQFFPSKM